MLVSYFVTHYVPFSLTESGTHNRVQDGDLVLSVCHIQIAKHTIVSDLERASGSFEGHAENLFKYNRNPSQPKEKNTISLENSRVKVHLKDRNKKKLSQMKHSSLFLDLPLTQSPSKGLVGQT